ncbi:MAG: hypothetical protein Q7T55_20665, partial [Solirubrobacteraceae bacterium]|nr:hypothetical protein [Solirubrobacteraceae bacterium]
MANYSGSSQDGNPYMTQLVGAIEAQGATVIPISARAGAVLQLLANEPVRAIHLHWPEYLVSSDASNTRARVRRVKSVLSLALALVLCRLGGVKV